MKSDTRIIFTVVKNITETFIHWRRRDLSALGKAACRSLSEGLFVQHHQCWRVHGRAWQEVEGRRNRPLCLSVSFKLSTTLLCCSGIYDHWTQLRVDILIIGVIAGSRKQCQFPMFRLQGSWTYIKLTFNVLFLSPQRIAFAWKRNFQRQRYFIDDSASSIRMARRVVWRTFRRWLAVSTKYRFIGEWTKKCTSKHSTDKDRLIL